jgi:hypothetical protein
MKTTNRYLSAVIAMMVVAIVVFLALDLPGRAFSLSALSRLVAPAAAPTPPPCQAIPLQSLASLTSANATFKLDVNGLIGDKRTQGDLTGQLATNSQKKSRITVSGGLLGELAAQVGGSLVGLFTPSKVDLYKVPDGTYIVVNGLFPVCVKPKALNATASLDEMSPQTLMTMLTSSDVACGKLVGTETRNGVAVKHYVINGDAFLAAAQNSSDPKLKEFGDALWSAEDSDLYIDAATGYPVAFSGNYSGEYAPIKFKGDFGVQLEMTGINTNPAVDLPSSCNKPISQ